MIKLKKVKIETSSDTLVDLAFNISSSTALVGESGSGKSLTLKALLNMLPNNLKLEIDIDSPFKLERGKTISFVPQNPFTALSPLTKISKQFFTTESRVKELFKLLDLDWRIYKDYPPNLSGGQLQRVILAMALVNNPKLLLLDEPTTALDANLRIELIDMLKFLQSKEQFLMLFVTHDINIASVLCENMVVLKKGIVVESGLSHNLLSSPKSSYTKLLIESNFKNREYRQ